MDSTTRRHVMTGATIGAAAALASPAAAQAMGQARAPGGKQDPRDKHPKPPFKPQSQP